jgi:transposase-like protein/Zn ribbon nucleic-acid-binding protein
MADTRNEDLWRDFPKTAIEFEKRFATEADCRAYWIEARWGGTPCCARCKSTRVWPERGGALFECADCGHQTSLTSGTLLQGTRKPFKTWFRAVFEISSRRNGISAKDLQRIMGFGSYETAWTWLHKLRAALVRPGREPLSQRVQIDEGFVGGTRGGKEMVLVATETTDGRVRLAHAENNDEATLGKFAGAHVAPAAEVTTDGLASYNSRSLGERPHEAIVQTKAERQMHDTLQGVHWTMSLLKRWLLGTHAGAVKPKHLQAYLDEFAFRHNRRKTKGVGRIAARTLAQLVVSAPMTMRMLVKETLPCRVFRS